MAPIGNGGHGPVVGWWMVMAGEGLVRGGDSLVRGGNGLVVGDGR